MLAIDILAVFLSISFIIYGTSCLISKKMIDEFNRFGIPQFRVLTGILQIMASIGLLLGFKFPILALLSSFGLVILMSMGFAVRLIIKDNWKLSAPSLVYACLSLLLFLQLFS